MKYKYKIGDKITVITDKEYKSKFFNQKGLISYIFHMDDTNPYDICFDDNMLNGYYSFAENELCLQGEENKVPNENKILKPIKTWEMVKKISKNPNKKFREINTGEIVKVELCAIHIVNCKYNCSLHIDDEWEEI